VKIACFRSTRGSWEGTCHLAHRAGITAPRSVSILKKVVLSHVRAP